MARSKEFDVNEALSKAAELFWRQGYEKTSMQELVEYTGVHKRSLYDTFGDKRTLYMKALEHYGRHFSSRTEARCSCQRTVKQAVREMFMLSIERSGEEPRGCLFINTAVELATLEPDAHAKVEEYFGNTEQRIRKLLASGQASGELAADLDIDALALYFMNALAGIRVLVKTTTDPNRLQTIVDTTMSILD